VIKLLGSSVADLCEQHDIHDKTLLRAPQRKQNPGPRPVSMQVEGQSHGCATRSKNSVTRIFFFADLVPKFHSKDFQVYSKKKGLAIRLGQGRCESTMRRCEVIRRPCLSVGIKTQLQNQNRKHQQ